VFKIVHAEFIAPAIKRFVIEAPRIARKQKPGQFIILRLHEHGERIPLIIERSDPERGTVNLVTCNGRARPLTCSNCSKPGAASWTLSVPWVSPPEIEKFGTVVIMGRGVGTSSRSRRAPARDLRGSPQESTGVTNEPVSGLRWENIPGWIRPSNHRPVQADAP